MKLNRVNCSIYSNYLKKLRLFVPFIILTFFIISCNKIEVNKDILFPRGEQQFIKNTDILWATPKGVGLTMDIYVPNSGRESYPVIIMFHGGGWLVNNKSIMNAASEYLATNSEFIVCNVNYRLLTDQNNTVKMNEIVEDAFGAVLWVKENIAKYKGDPKKVSVTGDSSGGHLAMMVLTQGHNLESDGFAGNSLGFNPSYLPSGKTAENIANENGLSVQAAMISYGVFDVYSEALLNLENNKNAFWEYAGANPRGIFGNEFNVNTHPNLYKQVSPIYTIPKVIERTLPPTFFSVGSKDLTTTPKSIEDFINKMHEAGHKNTEYFVHSGRSHAFLDSGSNLTIGSEFYKDAPPVLDKMVSFLNKYFY